ncbi:MAG: ester cyclase [Candidatus Dormibacteraeota bacterium]|nr:ester cyclase [Candidatus Dormibacteraeota bacterium]
MAVAMRHGDPAEALLRLVDAANAHDARELAASFDCSPAADTQRASGNHIERLAEAFFIAFPDCHFEVQVMVRSGDIVMCESTMTGTHLGRPDAPVLGRHLDKLKPSGRRVSVHHMHLFRVHEGRIVEYRSVRDDLGMMRQLGLLAKESPH